MKHMIELSGDGNLHVDGNRTHVVLAVDVVAAPLFGTMSEEYQMIGLEDVTSIYLDIAALMVAKPKLLGKCLINHCDNAYSSDTISSGRCTLSRTSLADKLFARLSWCFLLGVQEVGSINADVNWCSDPEV
jgi:hypothetical protein